MQAPVVLCCTTLWLCLQLPVCSFSAHSNHYTPPLLAGAAMCSPTHPSSAIATSRSGRGCHKVRMCALLLPCIGVCGTLWDQWDSACSLCAMALRPGQDASVLPSAAFLSPSSLPPYHPIPHLPTPWPFGYAVVSDGGNTPPPCYCPRSYPLPPLFLPVLLSSLAVAATSLLLSLLSTSGRSALLAAASGGGGSGGPVLALLLPLQLLSSLLSASVCVLGWLAGHAVLDVVCSERLRLLQRGEAGPYAALVAQGMGSDDAIVQVGGGSLRVTWGAGEGAWVIKCYRAARLPPGWPGHPALGSGSLAKSSYHPGHELRQACDYLHPQAGILHLHSLTTWASAWPWPVFNCPPSSPPPSPRWTPPPPIGSDAAGPRGDRRGAECRRCCRSPCARVCGRDRPGGVVAGWGLLAGRGAGRDGAAGGSDGGKRYVGCGERGGD